MVIPWNPTSTTDGRGGDYFAPVSCGSGLLQCGDEELRHFASLDGVRPAYGVAIENLDTIRLSINADLADDLRSWLELNGTSPNHPSYTISPIGLLQWPGVLDMVAVAVLRKNSHPLQHLSRNYTPWQWEEGRVETRANGVYIHTLTGRGRQTAVQEIEHESIRTITVELSREEKRLSLDIAEGPVSLVGRNSFDMLCHVNGMLAAILRRRFQHTPRTDGGSALRWQDNPDGSAIALWKGHEVSVFPSASGDEDAVNGVVWTFKCRTPGGAVQGTKAGREQAKAAAEVELGALELSL